MRCVITSDTKDVASAAERFRGWRNLCHVCGCQVPFLLPYQFPLLFSFITPSYLQGETPSPFDKYDDNNNVTFRRLSPDRSDRRNPHPLRLGIHDEERPTIDSHRSTWRTGLRPSSLQHSGSWGSHILRTDPRLCEPHLLDYWRSTLFQSQQRDAPHRRRYCGPT